MYITKTAIKPKRIKVNKIEREREDCTTSPAFWFVDMEPCKNLASRKSRKLIITRFSISCICGS